MQQEEERTFGRGLSSIRVRFTLLIAVVAVLTAFAAGVLVYAVSYADKSSIIGSGVSLALLFLGTVTLTYLMTGNLTRPIENLKASTEAIARGDYDAPVEVECNCEVGGLADSFKAMVTRLNANVSRIQTLAYEDGITGLPNRTVLAEAFANMDGKTGALLFIDLDNFKQINDIYGHQTGDQLLREAARRILEVGLESEAQDLVSCLSAIAEAKDMGCDCRVLFRFAGDEFVAVLGSVIDHDQLSEIAQRMVDCLSRPFEINGQKMSIGCSIGIVRIGIDSSIGDDLIKFADLAMYEAKNAGRGQFRFFDERMRAEATERMLLERDFSEALAKDQLIVHYQPKFNVNSGKLAGLEALVRWQHPQRGLLYPNSFLPIAEANGLMSVIGKVVLSKVVAQQRLWKEAGHDIPVAVNVCPTQFLQADFSDRFIAMAAAADIKPNAIVLEVTENIAILDEKMAMQHLRKIRAAGFKLAVDDFGVGYSNLAKLCRLPFDSLKLDRSLIETLDTDQTAQSVIGFAIGLAHSLGQIVVAEGVERSAQMQILEKLNCDEVQGFLLGKPAAATDVQRDFFPKDSSSVGGRSAGERRPAA